MKPNTPFLIRLVVCFVALLPPTARARGDGGMVRLSERRGDYQVTIFTAPTPFRAGPVDISVLVQDATTGVPVPDARITIRATPRDQPGLTLHQPATTDAATNKLFQAAVFELPAPGWWEIDVVIQGIPELTSIRFEVEAGEPLPSWFGVWPWFCWPGLVILLFGVHRWLVRRRSATRLPKNEPGPETISGFRVPGR